jgi:hypothetical protein
MAAAFTIQEKPALAGIHKSSRLCETRFRNFRRE